MPFPQVMTVTATTTVNQARKFVEEFRARGGGCLCPVCRSHRVVKAYRLNQQIVRAFCRLYYLWNHSSDGEVPRDAWSRWAGAGNDVTFLRFHRLIMQPVGDENKPFNRSGVWIPTQRGERWLNGRMEIPVEVYVDDNKKVGESTETWTIRKALGYPWNPADPYLPLERKRKRK